MYRNLNTQTLGISGRQSELIELALSNGFKGISVDIVDLARRAANYGVQHVCRFHKSAKIHIGTFELPDTWKGTEEDFQKFLNADLPTYRELAREIDAHQAVVSVLPGSDTLAYPENFELHRQRLAAIAEQLAQDDIRLGLGLRAARPIRQEFAYQFIYQVDDLLTLIKMVGADNVGLWYDSWNWKVGGGTFDQLREFPVANLVAVELADAPAEADLAEIDETQRLLPGEGGAIDCQAVVNYLRDVDYDGPVTPAPHRASLAGMTRGEIVSAASKALETLWQGAGLSRPIVPIAAAAAATDELAEEAVEEEGVEATATEATADAD